MGRILMTVQDLRAKRDALVAQEEALVVPFLDDLLKAHRADLAYENPIAIMQLDPPKVLLFKDRADYDVFLIQHKGK